MVVRGRGAAVGTESPHPVLPSGRNRAWGGGSWRICSLALCISRRRFCQDSLRLSAKGSRLEALAMPPSCEFPNATLSAACRGARVLRSCMLGLRPMHRTSITLRTSSDHLQFVPVTFFDDFEE